MPVLASILKQKKSIKEIEDEIASEIDSWNEYLRGYIYYHLYNSGMRVGLAQSLVAKVRKDPGLICPAEEGGG